MKERFFCPDTMTELLAEGSEPHDISQATKMSDMPELSRVWFERPARDGFEWICRNGKWPEEVPIPPTTEEEQQQIAYEQWKQERQQAVDAITVEVDGLIFDGDELSQNRMTRAATLAQSPEETVSWILADNSVATVTADQLRRAAREAGRVQETLWIRQEV